METNQRIFKISNSRTNIKTEIIYLKIGADRLKKLKELSKSHGISMTQICVQMIDYCLNDLDNNGKHNGN